MSRHKGIMSDALKYEIAQEIGIVPRPRSLSDPDALDFETSEELGAVQGASVMSSGPAIDWGNVSSRDCGNMVKIAIQRAEQNLRG